MRFAILGDHPDGKAIARALTASGRHQVAPRGTTDLEEILADPAIEAIIVAGGPNERLDQLRRVMQSERPALCVHPVDTSPDGAYEINMLQGDTHQVAVPILPLTLNKAVAALAEKLQSHVSPQMIELEFRDPGALLFEGNEHPAGPSFPGWDLLRRLGGAVAEVQAFAREESVHIGEPVTIQGRFETGTLFRVAYFPGQSEARLRISAVSLDAESIAESIHVADEDWARLVERFESAVARLRVTPRAAPGSGPVEHSIDGPSWLDEIRAAELDDAARRSIQRRRAVTLEYQEVSEDVGFKGTMTLVGCALIWAIPFLLILSVWFPYVGWLIVPVLFGFLLLQLLRWFVPMPPKSD